METITTNNPVVTALSNATKIIANAYQNNSYPPFAKLKFDGQQSCELIDYISSKVSVDAEAVINASGPALVSRASFDREFRYVEILFSSSLRFISLQVCIKMEGQKLSALKK